MRIAFLYVVLATGLGVFVAMLISMRHHRCDAATSPQPNATAECVWAVIPWLIVALCVAPAVHLVLTERRMGTAATDAGTTKPKTSEVHSRALRPDGVSQTVRDFQRTSDAAVIALAQKTRAPVDAVRRIYDEELAELDSTSTVKNFIEVLAGRRVKDRLREYSPPGPQ